MFREIEAETVRDMLTWEKCELRTLVRLVSLLDPAIEDWGDADEGSVVQTLLLKFAVHPENTDPEFACELGRVISNITSSHFAYETQERERKARSEVLTQK